MVRIGSVVASCLLLATAPAHAQNSDIFREDAPPAPSAPDHDPFQMAPANPAPAPKPAPRPRSYAPPAKEVIAPPPQPQPVVAPPPKHDFDGVYNGTVGAVSSGQRCIAGHPVSLAINQGHFTFTWAGDVSLDAKVDEGGRFDVSGKGFYGYVRLSGEIQNGELVGRFASQCTYDLKLKK